MSKARQLADLGNVYDDGALSNRNLIINGAMQVAQRGTSFTGLTNGSNGYTLDRWAWQESGFITLAMSVTQTGDSPDEMGNGQSLKVEVTTADASLGSDNRIRIEQYIEAQNCQRIAKGTSAAKQLTASFWVKSSKTGTYVLELQENDNDRVCSQSYTIDAANTWEYKTLVFPADTTGVINDDNGNGITFRLYLAAGTNYTSGTLNTSWVAVSGNATGQAVGQVNLADTVNATFYITGVQLEVGDTATPFEHRSYGDELARCQRYYYDTELSMVIYATQNGFYGVPVSHPVEMRASPSGSISGGSLQAGANASVTYRNPTTFRFTLQPNATGGVYYDNAIVTMEAEL